jgi:integrase
MIAPPLRLNKSTVDALMPREQEYVAWDSAVPGFGVRVYPSGVKTYILHVRVHGVQHKARLGRHGIVTAEQARLDARVRLADVQRGIVVDRNPPPRTTFADLAAKYLAEHAATRKKPSSQRLDRTNLRLHLLPRLGPMLLDTITPQEVLALHHAMHGIPVIANRVLSLLSTMFGLAQRWGLAAGDNPAQGIAPYRERRREIMLSREQRSRVLALLDQFAHDRLALPSVLAVIRVLLFTGARPGELLRLTWDQIAWDARLLRLADSKTGPKVVYLNDEALETLAGLEQTSVWVFPGATGKAPLVNVTHTWRRIRRLADLPEGTRLYDLRHTFASVAAEQGESLPMIGALLGHTQLKTTARYIHLLHAPVAEAARRVGKAVRGEEDYGADRR